MHCPLGDVAVISNMYNSNTTWWWKYLEYSSKYYPGMNAGPGDLADDKSILVQIMAYCSLTWTIVDPNLCHHMESLVYLSRLPWIFWGAPLKVNWAPETIQCNCSSAFGHKELNNKHNPSETQNAKVSSVGFSRAVLVFDFRLFIVLCSMFVLS